jgi:hypothetical protein
MGHVWSSVRRRMTLSDAADLQNDPLLRSAPTFEGFKVLDPVVLYQRLGQGGMGAVYRGRHCKLDLDVAVKCLKPSLAAEAPEFVARFEREARLCASLAHQNVVRVMDVRQQDGLHWLVMEYVRGETVRERVERKGPLPEAEALTILHGAAAGLAEAHARGIVHRDVKPENLMISLQGRVKVADLGLAKAETRGEHSISLASGVMGTPQYMAPEQWDSPDVGPAADVWALGATFYFLVTGQAGIAPAPFAKIAARVQQQDFPAVPNVSTALAVAAGRGADGRSGLMVVWRTGRLVCRPGGVAIDHAAAAGAHRIRSGQGTAGTARRPDGSDREVRAGVVAAA